MKKMKKIGFKKIFFVGIGGISMSGLCKICKFSGIEVCGSDMSQNIETYKLEALGVKIYREHSASNIDSSLDLVVYSGAIKSDNPELQKAKKLNIKIMERSKFLGIISKLFEKTIAIAGTHGKTTTTAMIGEILELNNMHPTIHLGGESVNLQDNTIIGESKYFVVEACEYRESFKFLHPTILAITNVEADHLDYYKDINEINKAFLRLMKKSKIVIKSNDVTFGKSNCIVGQDFCIKDLHFEECGYIFKVYYLNRYFDTYRLNMIGMHNVYNSLIAIAVCYHLNIDKMTIKKGIENFGGVKRRYETIGKVDGKLVIIDYAHHPTEIKSSIEGVQECYKKPLIVFQPHTYSRTLSLMDDFANVLSNKDLFLFETYPAREKEILGGRAIDLYEKLSKTNPNTNIEYFDNVDFVHKKMIEKLQTEDYDCVLILGAGNLAENLRKYF